MKFMLAFALFYLMISIKCQEFEKKDELLILNDNNFHSAIEQYEYLVVEFMAPWCEACKLFSPELEKAAKTLSTHDPVVGVAMVDGTANRKLTSEFNVTSYPTMKFFIRGDGLNYKLKVLSEQDVLDHVNENIGPGKSKLVNSIQQLEQFNQSNSILIIYFGPDDDKFLRFQSLTKQLPDFFYGHSFDEQLMQQLEISKPSIVLFKKQEEYRTDFTGPFNLLAMEQFVKHNKLGLLIRYKSEIKTYLEEEQNFILMLLYPRQLVKSDEAQQAKQALQQLAYELKDQIMIGLGNLDDDDGKELSEKLGIKKGQELLIIRIFRAGKDQYEKYKPEIGTMEEINYENLLKFYQQWKNNKLKPYLKSALLPKEQGLVQELIGDTFEQIVYDKTKDVLVLYYSKSCTLCKKVERVMLKLAEEYQELTQDLVFAKIDMDNNEIPEPLGTTEYPEVRFHTTRRKKGPAFWKKPYEIENLRKFLKGKLTVQLNEQKQKKKEDL